MLNLTLRALKLLQKELVLTTVGQSSNFQIPYCTTYLTNINQPFPPLALSDTVDPPIIRLWRHTGTKRSIPKPRSDVRQRERTDMFSYVCLISIESKHIFKQFYALIQITRVGPAKLPRNRSISTLMFSPVRPAPSPHMFLKIRTIPDKICHAQS